MKIKRISALLLAAVAVVSFTSCKKSRPKGADQKIKYDLSADPTSLDPQIASDTPSLIAVQAVYEGLTRLDSSGEARPGVAESWESSGGTQFTFHLRANARWSDKKYGTVTAADFVYAFRRALDPQTGSATCPQMFCIKNAKAIHAGTLAADSLGAVAKDAKTLVVTLEYACPDFPKIAASAVFMPCNQKFFEKTAGRYGLDATYLLSNGPFDLDSSDDWSHDKSLRLTRSSNYTGSAAVLPSMIDFTIGSKVSGEQALKTGAVDAAPVSSSRISSLRKAGCTLSSSQNTVWGLCFNTQSDIFKNEKMREAFTQAFSRKSVLSHLPEGASAAESVFLPGTTLNGAAFQPADGRFYLKQDAGAAQTLAAGMRELNLQSLSPLTVLCPDDPNIKLMINEMITAWNSQFNNYFNLEPLSESSLQTHIRSGDYDFAVCPLKPDTGDPSAMLSLFTSGADGNPACLKDSAYDALVSSAQTKGGSGGMAADSQAAEYLGQKAIFYPLYYGKSYYASAQGVSGIVFYPFHGIVDFRNTKKG